MSDLSSNADTLATALEHVHESAAAIHATGLKLLIQDGKAPPPFFFAFEPPPGRSRDVDKKFAALLGASALARISAGMSVAKSRYTIGDPDQYVAAFNEKSEATFNAFTKPPLSAIYEHPGEGRTINIPLDITRAELHTTVISHVFDGLPQVGTEQLKKLDGVLTGLTTALKPLKVRCPGKGEEPLPVLKHVVAINYVKATDITGGSGGADGGIYVYESFTRVVVIVVKPEQWALALRKTPPPPEQWALALRKTPPPPEQKPSISFGTEQAPAGHSTDHGTDHHSGHGFSYLMGLMGGGKKNPEPEEHIKFDLSLAIMDIQLNDKMYDANKLGFEAILQNMAKGDAELGKVAEKEGLVGLGRRSSIVYQAANA
ncbi:hypothetical protein RB595_010188 [Gaeumannomyces hyphopodioides]